MRLLHITDRLSNRGGADWNLLGVLHHLARSHDVLQVVGRCDENVTIDWHVETVRGLDAGDAQPTEDPLGAIARAFEPDIIHVHNVMNPESLAWAADRGAIMTVQDHRVFCPGRGKLKLDGQPCTDALSRERCGPCFKDADYFARILGLTMARLEQVRRMRRITVLSDYVRRELVCAGVEDRKVEVIPPFVHGLRAAAPADDRPCVLFAGRLATAKGVWDAVEAWRRSEVDLPLVFAGTGSERGALERAGFQVLGWLSHEALPGVFAQARALLLPSRWQEPFGIIGIEAQQFGVPVVAWDSGGVAEWHRGPWIAPWGDLDALARHLKDAVTGDRPAPTPDLRFNEINLMQRLTTLYAAMTSE